MLPLSLLNASIGKKLVVEMKNGDTYHGILVEVDAYMNIKLKDVIYTSKDQDNFTQISTIYIRGISVKYMNIPEDAVNELKEKERAVAAKRFSNSNTRNYKNNRSSYKNNNNRIKKNRTN